MRGPEIITLVGGDLVASPSDGKPATPGWRRHSIAIVLSLLIPGAPLQAPAQTAAPVDPGPNASNLICPIIESAARANGLPVDFFTRVIWQESRFRPDVVGPLTRSGAHALGIAQFMPGTAAERGLYEPFNPAVALPKSGEFLAELRNEFGNLGLAAAAYNAGPQRVRDFITRSRDLPAETRNYVLSITGNSIEEWAKRAKEGIKEESNAAAPSDHVTACRDLVALLKQPVDPFFAEWLRKAPSWCRHLHHPSTSVCGPIHEQEVVANTSSLMKQRSRVVVRKASLH